MRFHQNLGKICAAAFVVSGLILTACAPKEPTVEDAISDAGAAAAEQIQNELSSQVEKLQEEANREPTEEEYKNSPQAVSDGKKELAENVSFVFSHAEPVEDSGDFKIYGTLANDNDEIVNIYNLDFSATMRGENEYRQAVDNMPADVSSFASYDGGNPEYSIHYSYGMHDVDGFFNLQPHVSQEVFGFASIDATSAGEATEVTDVRLDSFDIAADYSGEKPNLATYSSIDFGDDDYAFMPVAEFSSDLHGVSTDEFGDGSVEGTLTNNTKYYLNDVSGIYLYQGPGIGEDGDVAGYYEFNFEPVAPGDSTPLNDTYGPLLPTNGTYTLVGVLAEPSVTP